MPDKLLGVHPDLAMAVPKIMQAMAVLGFEMRVTDGLRTVEQQQELFSFGRTQPGRIVTKADGVVHRSNHQVRADGFGAAVDMTFWVEGAPSWAEDLPWNLYGTMAEALGLRWGGRWKSPDKPHVELP